MISEAYKDSWMTDDPRRVRMPAFTGSHAGVTFVDGDNVTPMPAKTLRRLVTAGVVIEDLGPWPSTPSEPASPAREPPPSPDAGDAAPDLSPDPAATAPADDASPATDTSPKARKAPR